MTQHEFMNRLRSLFNIDMYMLPEFKPAEWEMFRRDPTRFLIQCGDDHANAIWREVEKRQKP